MRIKRSLFLLLGCLGYLLIPVPLIAQIAFHDAHRIAHLLQVPDSLSLKEQQKLYAILRLYIQQDSLAPLSDTQIHHRFQRNPLFPKLPPPLPSAEITEKKQDSLGANMVDGAVKGLNVNTALEGSAAFLVERVETELNLAFFNRFSQQLVQDSFLTYFLPHTQQTLESLGSEIYLYPSFWNSLQQSFRLDLQALPQDMERYLQNPSQLAAIQPEALRLFLPTILTAVEMSVSGQHPAAILQELASFPPVPDSLLLSQSDWANLRSALQVLDLLSQSLQSGNSSQRHWLPPKDLYALSQDSTRLRLYVGLLHQQSQDITFYHPYKDTLVAMPFAADLEKLIHSSDQLVQFLATCMRFLDEAKRIEALLSTPPPQQALSSYLQYAAQLVQLMEQGIQMSSPFIVSTSRGASPSQTLKHVFSHASQLNISARQHRYGMSVLHFSQLHTHLFPNTWTPKRKAQWLRYGSFMAQVAQAEDSENLVAILEHAALPPTSAALKKHSAFSISLNAYVGISAGNERLRATSGVPQQDGAYLALSAPIGLGFNWGIGRHHPASLSLFASLIDIGALTAYRFEHTSVEELPTLSLENVWAPGLYVMGGLPKVPISLGVGIQNGPQLRKVQAQQQDLENRSAWRWGALLAVDIPIFNLMFIPR